MSINNCLEHYGVLGMKWGVHKNPSKTYSKATDKLDKIAKKANKYKNKFVEKENARIKKHPEVKVFTQKNKRFYNKAMKNRQKAINLVRKMDSVFVRYKVSDFNQKDINRAREYCDSLINKWSEYEIVSDVLRK